ncbi:MAG: DUF4112 domain-containing protein [Phycisphaerales bacterium]|nr:DUF4112 domain-containing protein [Phycisphaerales bacterium]
MPDALPRSLALARLLDARFSICGVRFGLDPIIGLLPVAGDTVSAALGLLIVADAVRLGARPRVVGAMLANLGLDWLVGLVPGLDIPMDILFKANLRNARLLEREWREGWLAGRRTRRHADARTHVVAHAHPVDRGLPPGGGAGRRWGVRLAGA